MFVPSSQISQKRIIGHKGSHRVFLINTIGGLSMVCLASATPEILAVAPHDAISKHIAQKRCPDIKFNLEKSEDFPIDTFSNLIERYEAISDKLSLLQNKVK